MFVVEMGLIPRKPFSKVCDQLGFKPGCLSYLQFENFEVLVLALRWWIDSYPRLLGCRGDDLFARICRLVCAFVFWIHQRQCFSRPRSNLGKN